MHGLDFKKKLYLCCILTVVVVMIVLLHHHHVREDPVPIQRSSSDNLSSKLPGFTDLESLPRKGSKEKIEILAKLVHNARKHVRGSKTSDYLNEAKLVMNNIIKEVGIDEAKVYERYSTNSKHICQETYKGGSYGFPMYYEGFVAEKCSNAVAISKLLTVVKYINGETKDKDTLSDEVEHFIASVKDTVKSLNVFIAINVGPRSFKLRSKYTHMKVVQGNYSSEGSALNTLMKEMKTPYVLVARNTQIMTNDSRLERLIHEIESLKIVAAGGAFRTPNGRWTKGCYQSMYRNYTLKYLEGYDESFHECLFCDFIQGPFVSSTEYLMKNEFLDINENNGLYEDFFLRISQSGKESVVCPDSMFHVHEKPTSSDSDWKKVAKKWKLQKIQTPNGRTITQSCSGPVTGSRPSRALSPCALELNTNAVNGIMRTCEEVGAICELLGGSTLGAVKLGKVLPWEYDFDAKFLATNCTVCKKLEVALSKAGYKFSKFSLPCCTKKLKLKDTINSGGFYEGKSGDFHGKSVLDSDLLIKSGFSPTKVLLGGLWVNVNRNPGLAVRNRYGVEIYRHAEHWRFSGDKNRDKMMDYKANMFLPCKNPGYHDCLDRFNTDGDLPFMEMLP